MTQADLVRLYFANGESHSTWTYCFNQQCPLAWEGTEKVPSWVMLV